MYTVDMYRTPFFSFYVLYVLLLGNLRKYTHPFYLPETSKITVAPKKNASCGAFEHFLMYRIHTVAFCKEQRLSTPFDCLSITIRTSFNHSYSYNGKNSTNSKANFIHIEAVNHSSLVLCVDEHNRVAMCGEGHRWLTRRWIGFFLL